MSDILKDSRFVKYLNDPKYKQIPKHERKIKIDKRFHSMFEDDKFKVKYTVDKRGRPVNETSTENLKKYYDIESGQSSSEEENDEDKEEAKIQGRFVKRPSSPSTTFTDDEEETETNEFVNDKLERGKLDKKTKKRLLDLDIDYARGEGTCLTIYLYFCITSSISSSLSLYSLSLIIKIIILSL